MTNSLLLSLTAILALCDIAGVAGQIRGDECRRFYWSPRLMNRYLHENWVVDEREDDIPQTRKAYERNLPSPYRILHPDEQDEYNHRQHYRLTVYVDDNNHVTKLKCC
ncbi:hypothetical protein DL89DRAFT_266652 [Linderina pennispora]|uniref:Uncharacterized protein n=1 Tax=Linderina pennispora TaxID=61395 RepID=A0A1Y1WA83_9FUNG|nr:uncharacterized protein DL89DRAFT_266652 [Linderina pennispora]ORX70433.1 hypothetical protein DL89DRAFT_266652 [Linderina pennispora]